MKAVFLITSPIGILRTEAENGGIGEITPLGGAPPGARPPFARWIAVHSVESRGTPAARRHVERLVDHLRSFFAGAPSDDEIPLQLRGTPFQLRVWEALRRIPPGQTKTYGQVAAELGVAGGARAVGAACGRNPVLILVPCHRVVAARGIGGFSGGLEIKEWLLHFERAYYGMRDAGGAVRNVFIGDLRKEELTGRRENV